MSKYLTHRLSSNSLVIMFTDSVPVTVKDTHPMFSEIKARLAYGKTDDIMKFVNYKEAAKLKRIGIYNTIKKNGIDCIVASDNSVVNCSISKMILQLQEIDKDIDTSYLLNFWANMCLNEEPTSIESLFDWIQANKLTITDDGCFIGYRAVRKDFKDKYSGTFDNSVGQVVSMDRSKVTLDRDRTCAAGLHVANFEYARNSYGSPGDIIVAVKVNPADVVSVPYDYSCAKMRVCRYTVMEVVENELGRSSYDTLAFREEHNIESEGETAVQSADGNVELVSLDYEDIQISSTSTFTGKELNIPTKCIKQLSKGVILKPYTTFTVNIVDDGLITIASGMWPINVAGGCHVSNSKNRVRISKKMFTKAFDLPVEKGDVFTIRYNNLLERLEVTL